MRIAVELRSLSRLEQGRLPEPSANPWRLEGFVDLELSVSDSLTQPDPQDSVHARAKMPAPPPSAEFLLKRGQKQSFADDTLLKKLVQFRDQIPLSSRIIRARDT